jgi:diguanylate cyclase (GGDEF)-like protein
MITKKVFHDLAIFMMGFGVFIGIIFPFFSLALQIPREYVLQPLFIILCILAGLFVGAFNLFLARKIVGSKIKLLSKSMKHIESVIIARNTTGSEEICTPENCMIPVTSDDEIGESAAAFNGLVTSLSKSYQTERDLKNFNQVISSKLDLDQLASFALEQLMIRSASNGGLLIVDRNGNLDIIANSGIKNDESLLNNPILWRVFRTNQMERIALPDDIIIDGVLIDFRPKEIVFIPIVYKDISLGVLLLASVKTFTNDSLNDLQLFIGGLAMALRNAITHVQLQELAAADPLTNVFNRRFGLLRLQEEYARAVRLNSPIGLMMCDIDHFKNVNDTYGHLVGDKVLIQIAKLAKNAIREGDIFIRYGGEEFLAILPGASQSDTRNVAEKFRRIIEEMTIQHIDQNIKVTISIGISSFPEAIIASATDLIDLADKSLYRAKENGRNRVL